MQSIYACWTLWGKAHNKQPVLVGPSDHVGFGPTPKNQFIVGIFKVMKEALNVKVMTTEGLDKADLDRAVDLELWGYQWDGKAFFMRREDAWKWTEKILQNQKIERSGCNGVLRFGILNRHPKYGRSILNAREIMDQMLHLFGRKVHVTEVRFEDFSFQQQCEFFASHDIIFSGHGAQETGLPFMPKCGTLLEIFPSVYFVPEYFSTLSDSTHVRHFMMVNNRNPDPVAETKENAEPPESELKAKQTSFCPTMPNILTHLLTAIRDWDRCCNADGNDSP